MLVFYWWSYVDEGLEGCGVFCYCVCFDCVGSVVNYFCVLLRARARLVVG